MAHRGQQQQRTDPPDVDGMTSLKIDNISTRTGPNELRRAFDRYGEIGDIHIPRDRYTGDNKGFAFVRFYSRRDAEHAMDKMDGERIDGRLVRVVMARYSRPCDERAKRRTRGRDDGDRREKSRSRSRSRDRPRRNRSRSRSKSKSKTSDDAKPKKRDTSKSSSRSPSNKNGRDRSRSRSRS